MRHQEATGAWHYDWMIDRIGGREDAGGEAGEQRVVATFRVMVRPDDSSVRVFDGERLPDHRAVYLTREGDIGEGRGVVSRIGAGWCTIARLDDAAADLIVDIGGTRRRVVGRHVGGNAWRFSVAESPGR